MQGGTTFHFVDDGSESALAGRADRLGGRRRSSSTCTPAWVDDMHVAIVPTLLGGGERLFERLDGAVDGYECGELVSSPAVAHVRLARR